MKTLGFIGAGGMGSGMAANLIKAGYRLVVNDLRREQAKALESQGAEFKDTPKAVAESCDLVLSMLPNHDAVRAVGLGAGGLAEATGGAKLWIDFSSIDKDTIVSVNETLVAKGWTVVDASAGGVEEVAAAGEVPERPGAARREIMNVWLDGGKGLRRHFPAQESAQGRSRRKERFARWRLLKEVGHAPLRASCARG
jgi:3-hydroxyisobutyrate dehydrogenase-like beta-hydroxyacid dehydrogenase